MLREIKHVRQERVAGRRRWFESEALDLVVWLDRNDVITGFQICYELGRGEHTLTWREDGGFAHHAVDSGDHSAFGNSSPVLCPGGRTPWGQITRLFDAASGGLEPDLRHLVRSRLEEGPRR